MSAIGGHQYRGHTDEWLTPPEMLQALGPFDLDPCAPVQRPWPTATHHYTIEDDGYQQEWEGFVWLNPPYGPETGRWLRKLARHGNGLALIFARTETAMFFRYVWEQAQAVFFLQGRLHFHYVTGERAKFNGGAPSVLVGYGTTALARLQASGLPGKLVVL